LETIFTVKTDGMKILGRLIEATVGRIAALVSIRWHCRGLDEVERLTFLNLHSRRMLRRNRDSVADVRVDLQEAKRRVAQMREHPKTGRSITGKRRSRHTAWG
jgi:hypothetical protein